MKTKAIGVINGKVETKRKPRTLDEILGYDALSEYKTLDPQEYKESLSEMNMADLQVHAVQKGVLPGDSRERTVQRLMNAFAEHRGKYCEVSTAAKNRPSKKKEELARKIMSQ